MRIMGACAPIDNDRVKTIKGFFRGIIVLTAIMFCVFLPCIQYFLQNLSNLIDATSVGLMVSIGFFGVVSLISFIKQQKQILQTLCNLQSIIRKCMYFICVCNVSVYIRVFVGPFSSQIHLETLQKYLQMLNDKAIGIRNESQFQQFVLHVQQFSSHLLRFPRFYRQRELVQMNGWYHTKQCILKNHFLSIKQVHELAIDSFRFPIDQSTFRRYCIILTLEMIGGFSILICVSVVGSFFVSMCIYMIAFVQHFKLFLTDIDEMAKSGKNLDRVMFKTKFSQLIQYHNEIHG